MKVCVNKKVPIQHSCISVVYMSFGDNVVTVTVHLFAYEALQPCGRHYCYYGGTCVNSSCSCPLHTFGVYCEYTTGEPYTAVKFQCKHQRNLYEPLERNNLYKKVLGCHLQLLSCHSPLWSAHYESGRSFDICHSRLECSC